MVTITEHRARGVVGYPPAKPSAKPQPALVSAPAFTAPTKSSSLSDSTAPDLTEIPEQIMRLEPKEPINVTDDNPVVRAYTAARILGCSYEHLRKWRQQSRGPDYIQYELNGAICYEVSALMEFRAKHIVKPGPKS